MSESSEPASGEKSTGARELVDQSGRRLGPRALQTRQRLLDATEKLLAERNLRDLRVIEITRLVGTSAATFYQYFRGTDEAVLCLAEQVSEEMPGILAEIAGSWQGEPGLEKARRIVDAFIRYWDEHRTVLRARNLASEEDDPRFQALRSRTMSPVIQELARAIEVHRRKARPKAHAHALAAAAAMATILERIAAYHRELEGFGMTRSDLVESSAEILHRTVTGE